MTEIIILYLIASYLANLIFLFSVFTNEAKKFYFFLIAIAGLIIPVPIVGMLIIGFILLLIGVTYTQTKLDNE